MSQNVEYQISLKDLLSSGVKKAEQNVEHFEGTLEHTSSLIKQLSGAAVGFLGGFAAVDFFKSSIEEFNQAEKSIAAINAGIASTKGIAGETTESLKELADTFAGQFVGDDDIWLDAEAQLLSFHNIGKGVFEDAMLNIADIAAKTGNSVHETALQIGKAFNDPSTGLGALGRAGVKFDDAQTAQIKKLQETGHLLEAQHLLIEQINIDYAGTAKAIAETDQGQMTLLNQQWLNVKQDLGKVLMKEFIKLTPMIKDAIEGFKSLVEWATENIETIKHVGKAILEVTAAVYTFGKVKSVLIGIGQAWEFIAAKSLLASEAMAGTNILAAETASAQLAAAGTGGVAVAETAGVGFAAALAANPVGLAIIGSAATLLAIYGLFKFFGNGDTDEEGQKWYDKEQEKHKKEDEDESMYNLSYGLKSSFGGKKNNTFDTYTPILNEQNKEHFNAAFDMVHSAKGDENITKAQFAKMAIDNKDLQKAIVGFTNLDKSEIFKIVDAKPVKQSTAKTNATLADVQTTIQGQTVKNIYVTINGGLVHDFRIQTTNLKESASEIKRIVTETLTDAINDSEVNN